MSNFTVQTIRAAALLLFAAVCTAVQADGPKRIVSVQKAKKHVVLNSAESAVTPTPLKARPGKSSTAQRDILVDEDFSGITWGSEEQPDTTSYLASSYYEPGIYIDPSLTKDGTWAGEFAHAAGGMVYLKTPNSMYSAALMTPLGDYSGELTVTLKAKAMPHWQVYGEDPDTGEELWYKSTGSSIGVEVCKGGYLDYEIADTDLEDGTGYYSTRLYEGQGWTEVELHFNNYSADNDGFVCFYTEGAILIDDIKITSAPTFLATPKMIGVTDFQADRFTIAWQPLRKALDYYVDLYKKVYTSDTDGAFAEDFENFTAPQEGWTTTSTETAAGAGPDGSTALILRGGDTLTTPENGATYKSMDFYLKFVTHYEDPSYSWGVVYIDGLTDAGWKAVSYIYAYYFAEGDMVNLADEIYGFANTYKAIRIRPADMEEGEYIIVDNVGITTNRPSVLERVWGENSSDWGEDSNDTRYDYTEDTEYTFTGLDPETEYYYGVRGHYVFTYSDKVLYHALGVCPPKVLPATGVDSRGAFTANWEKAPKATGYVVSMYGVEQIEETSDDYVLLEETFDKVDDSVTSATDWRSPDMLGNYEGSPLDDYTLTPGWLGAGNTLVQGMLGCEYSPYILTEIITPEIYVGNDDELKMYMKAYGDAGDQLILRLADGSVYYVPFETAADGTGYIDNTYIMPVTSETMRMEIFTYNYGAFMLDELRFTQAVEKGDMLKTTVATVETDAETTSYEFTNLDAYGFNRYGYHVISQFDYEGESTTSVSSDIVIVDLGTGESEITTGIEEAAQAVEATETARYSVDGRRLAAPQRGLNIVKMSDGTTRKVVVK